MESVNADKMINSTVLWLFGVYITPTNQFLTKFEYVFKFVECTVQAIFPQLPVFWWCDLNLLAISQTTQ